MPESACQLNSAKTENNMGVAPTLFCMKGESEAETATIPVIPNPTSR